MKVILTEGQLNQLIQEEVIEEGFLSSLLKLNNMDSIVKKIAIALIYGAISFGAVPKILDKVEQNAPSVAGSDAMTRDEAIEKIKMLYQNVKNKEAAVTGQMQADAKKTATAISDTALSQICKWETLRNFGYKMSQKDLQGYHVNGESKKTYGYGLRTHPNGKFMEDVKQVWTQPELEKLFKEKINKETQWVLNWAAKNGVELGQGQLDAMVSAVYNYGRTGFLKTGIPAMIAQNPDNPEIPQVWAAASDHRKKMGGLHSRRRAEAEWYQKDIQQANV